jgi:4'-phosphopantetheinyl transferase
MTKTTFLELGPPSGVQIWIIRLDLESRQTNQFVPWLSSDEVARSERFLRPEDRSRYVICRAALRGLIAAHLGVPLREVSFDYGEYGKPKLSESMRCDALNFNVAHSRDLGCIAVGWGSDLGIDVEAIRPLNDLDVMIDKTLTATERQYVLSVPENDRLEAFFRHWTLKEALVKAVGLGLQCPFWEIELDLCEPVRIVRLPSLVPTDRRFYLHELDLGQDYCGAVATESAEAPRIEEWRWPEAKPNALAATLDSIDASALL